MGKKKKRFDSGNVFPESSKKKEKPKGAMDVAIVLPEGIERFYPTPEAHEVHTNCAAKIHRMNEIKKATFQDYVEMKSGGVDGWARAKVENEFNNRVRDFVASFFSDPRRVSSCLQWYGRGLALDHAIRKELVALEVTANATRIKRKRRCIKILFTIIIVAVLVAFVALLEWMPMRILNW